MSIERGDFDAISEGGLQELVTAQVPEGRRLEYKEKTYGNDDKQKHEFLKDISALANTQGGHLILGVRETAGAASQIVGLGDIDADAELVRLEQMASGGVEPKISGLRMKRVSLTNGKDVILIHVPRSWNPPHRVAAKGSNRFYVRHSAGVHQPGIEELRALFTESTSALDQARKFRDERISEICSGTEQRPLCNNGRFVLHIAPITAFSGRLYLDVQQIAQKSDVFRPLGAVHGFSSKYNYAGFINERGGAENVGYTQISRYGTLEATKANIIREDRSIRFIPGLAHERYFFETFHAYLIGLRDIGVPPPLLLMVTMEGVQGVEYVIRETLYTEGQSPFPHSTFALPECILEDYGTELDHHRVIRPAFDALWNAVGYPRDHFFNADGRWVGQ